MPRPIRPERPAFGSCSRNSLSEKPKPLMFFMLTDLALPCTAWRPVSASLMISATANMPIITVSMEKPPFSSLKPKVKRRIASTGAMPTVEIAMPRAPANRPLTIEPADSVAISVSENTAIAKYSCGPKLSATLASCGAMNINATMLKMVPRNENTIPTPSALTP